jgi:RNA ligase (TIGR02306 family)
MENKFNMERKLVTLRTITEIKPIPDADRICAYILDGWQVVDQVGKYEVGELVVFFEIDSLLPIREEFEFLRKSSYVQKNWLEGIVPNGEGFRLRSIKLKKTLSQGLITKILNDSDLATKITFHEIQIGEDLSEYFGVIKYDPPQRTAGLPGGIPKGNFPWFIPKTDQERIQNIHTSHLQECIDSGELFEVTQKYHGSSITIFYIREGSQYQDEKHSGLGICSRNVYLKIEENPDNHFVKTTFDLNLHKVIEVVSDHLNIDLAIQGEICGPGINQNWHGLESYNIFIFDIYNITERRYFSPVERWNIIQIMLQPNLNSKYIGAIADLFIPEQMVNRGNDISNYFLPIPSTDRSVLLEWANYKLPNGKPNEGLVFKSATRDFSFKVVNNEFLLNGGEESEG